MCFLNTGQFLRNPRMFLIRNITIVLQLILKYGNLLRIVLKLINIEIQCHFARGLFYRIQQFPFSESHNSQKVNE